VHGQTYILESKDNFYESQVSSFATLHGMDLTPGHSQIEAGDFKNALGERLSISTAKLCFGCHTTYSSTNSEFDVTRAIPGVRCEACHGPGADHVNAVKRGQIDEALKAILNPARLSPVALVDFLRGLPPDRSGRGCVRGILWPPQCSLPALPPGKKPLLGNSGRRSSDLHCVS